MNSSGIKRGLAASAIGALAVTGVPALTTSASAEPGDIIQVQSTSTTRSGSDQGATIVLNTRNVDPTLLELAGTNLTVGTGGEDNNTQSVDIIGTRTLIASGAEGDATPNNGLDQITLRVKVTTPPGGDDTADFVIFEDENSDDVVDLSEARTQTSVETTGPVTSIDVAPATQSAPSGQSSSAYTVTIRDAEGDLTQLTSGESLTLTDNGDLVFGGDGDGDAITPEEIGDGTAEFTATGTKTGQQTITVAQGNVSDTAVLNVTPSATLTLDDIDVVTGADNSDGAPANNPTLVRVDQSSVRLDIDSDDKADANSTVTFTVTSEGGNGVTFGGKPSTTVSTTLDANGVGSVTITPDAGTIQEGDGFSVTGSGINDLDFIFQRSTVDADSVDAPERVFTKVDTPTSVTVTVTDQFGDPVQGAQVSATSKGDGVNDTRPRQTTNASGQTTFTFPAGDTQDGDTDTITYTVFKDAADATGTPANETTKVTYTTEGVGPDYQLTLDGENTEGPTYSPDDVTVEPLTDAVANDSSVDKGDEVVVLTIANGETGLPVEVSVNNGARILTGNDVNLADGEPTVTGKVGDTFRIVGTKSGLVTVTTTTGGRTETAQFTVEAQDDRTTARNVGVSGPATVPAGTSQVPFTAVITDAFGNPVPGVPVTELNVQVSGPGQLQDSGAVTDAQGQIQLNVRLDDDAEGPVTITVTGIPGDDNQFGDPATKEGLPASSNVASATTTVEPAEEPEPEPEPNPEPAAIRPGIKLMNVTRQASGMDWVKVGARNAKGAKVKLFRILDNGTRKLVRTGNISDKGQKIWILGDRNKKGVRTFQAIVVATDTNQRGVTKRASIR